MFSIFKAIIIIVIQNQRYLWVISIKCNQFFFISLHFPPLLTSISQNTCFSKMSMYAFNREIVLKYRYRSEHVKMFVFLKLFLAFGWGYIGYEFVNENLFVRIRKDIVVQKASVVFSLCSSVMNSATDFTCWNLILYIKDEI